MQRLLNGSQRQAEGGELEVGQLDPDLLVLQTQQFDLADIRHPLQLNLDTVRVVLEHGIVEAVAGQGVDIAESGAEFIVEKRTLDIRRQGLANIADLLAHLVPEVRDLRGMHRVPGHEGDLGFAGAGEGNDALVVAGLHQFLFNTLGDLA